MTTTPITITICPHSVDRRLTRCLLCDPDKWGEDYWSGYRRGEQSERARLAALVRLLPVQGYNAASDLLIGRAAVLAAIEGDDRG